MANSRIAILLLLLFIFMVLNLVLVTFFLTFLVSFYVFNSARGNRIRLTFFLAVLTPVLAAQLHLGVSVSALINSANVYWGSLVSVAAQGNVSLLLTLLVFGGIVRVFEDRGVLNRLAEIVLKQGKQEKLSKRTAQFSIFSCLSSIDDYLGTVVFGKAFSPLFEKAELSKERLLLFVTTLSVSGSVLIPFSSWGVYLSSLLGISTGSLLRVAIFNFYVFVAIALLLWVAYTNRSSDDPPFNLRKKAVRMDPPERDAIERIERRVFDRLSAYEVIRQLMFVLLEAVLFTMAAVAVAVAFAYPSRDFGLEFGAFQGGLVPEFVVTLLVVGTITFNFFSVFVSVLKDSGRLQKDSQKKSEVMPESESAKVAIDFVIPLLIIIVGAAVLLGLGLQDALLVSSMAAAVYLIPRRSLSLIRKNLESFLRGVYGFMEVSLFVLFAFAARTFLQNSNLGGIVQSYFVPFLSKVGTDYTPLFIFVLTLALSYAIGTSFGAYAIMSGVIAEVFTDNSGLVYLISIGAMLGGGLFGNLTSVLGDQVYLSQMVCPGTGIRKLASYFFNWHTRVALIAVGVYLVVGLILAR